VCVCVCVCVCVSVSVSVSVCVCVEFVDDLIEFYWYTIVWWCD